jgi:hypothetical protein
MDIEGVAVAVMYVVNKMGADFFIVSTDYPHSDGAFSEATIACASTTSTHRRSL